MSFTFLIHLALIKREALFNKRENKYCLIKIRGSNSKIVFLMWVLISYLSDLDKPEKFEIQNPNPKS